MILARAYIPKYPNGPVTDLESRLVAAFGGYSKCAMGVGVWQDPDTNEQEQEPIYIYDVVLDDEDQAALRHILEQYKEDAEQKSVLYILNGQPTFI